MHEAIHPGQITYNTIQYSFITVADRPLQK